MKELDLSNEQLNEISDLTSLNYSLLEISKVMKITYHQLVLFANTTGHPVKESINTGKLQQNSLIDKLLLKQAKEGSTWAVDLLSKRLKQKEVDKMINDYLGEP